MVVEAGFLPGQPTRFEQPAGLAGGVLIGLAYFLASEMTANSGQVFNLNAAVVTWLPSVALLLVTGFALTRVK